MLVKNIRIQYGEGLFPFGSDRYGLRPDHLPHGSDTFTAPIPEFANVQWESEVGNHFHARVPMRSLIKDTRCFYGFRFSFVENQLDIYVLNKKYDCNKLIELDRIKVYSVKSD